MATALVQSNTTFNANHELLICELIQGELQRNSPQSCICQDTNPNLFGASTILSDDEQIELSQLITCAPSSLIGNIPFKSSTLIFNAKKDGYTRHSFYNKCDKKRNTLVLIQSVPTPENDFAGNKVIFGGFTTQPWESGSQHVEDKDAFLFRLRANEYGATLFPLKNYSEFAVYQRGPPDDDDEDDEEDGHEIFYFGQPTALLLADHCDQNEHSFCDGGKRINYDIPFKGSLLGL
eukprot:98776_1